MLCFRFLTPSYGRAGSILILLGTHVLVNIRSRSVKLCFAQSMLDERPVTCIGPMPSAHICVFLSRLIQGRSHGMTIITRLCSGNSNIDTVPAFSSMESVGTGSPDVFLPNGTEGYELTNVVIGAQGYDVTKDGNGFLKLGLIDKANHDVVFVHKQYTTQITVCRFLPSGHCTLHFLLPPGMN